jgi:hypothetical protein
MFSKSQEVDTLAHWCPSLWQVEWAKEGGMKEGHHLPGELTRLIATSLREVHKTGAGDEEGSALDVYEICKMLGPGTGQQVFPALRLPDKLRSVCQFSSMPGT